MYCQVLSFFFRNCSGSGNEGLDFMQGPIDDGSVGMTSRFLNVESQSIKDDRINYQ
jgi:hypothetical protein